MYFYRFLMSVQKTKIALNFQVIALWCDFAIVQDCDIFDAFMLIGIQIEMVEDGIVFCLIFC